MPYGYSIASNKIHNLGEITCGGRETNKYHKNTDECKKENGHTR